MIVLADEVIDILQRAAELRSDRMQLLAGNVANIDTPGYLPVDLDFQKELRRYLAGSPVVRTDERHLPPPPTDVQPEVFSDPQIQPGLDGNAVSLERQVAKIGENRMLYEATLQALRKKLALLRYAVNEGGA